MLQHDFSDQLKAKLKKLFKKDRPRYGQLLKKIESICASTPEELGHFKNLRYDLSDRKRVHIGSFVLTFHFYRERHFIFFLDFDHHDDAY